MMIAHCAAWLSHSLMQFGVINLKFFAALAAYSHCPSSPIRYASEICESVQKKLSVVSCRLNSLRNLVDDTRESFIDFFSLFLP